MARVHLALGANLGDRAETLHAALAALDADPGTSVVATSTFHETEPVGGPPDQPAFLNAAAVIETASSPEELLERLLAIEVAHGRDRTREERWGPRRLDLDIILWEDRVIRTDRLTIPHPRAAQRSFVLGPLAEIAPDARDPISGASVAELLARLSSTVDS